MTEFEAAHPETPQGQAVFQELLFIHAAIRHDLAVVERLAGEVTSGLPPHELDAEIHQLQTNGPLWQLKVNCLRYCRFVHLHHHIEDTAFFPSLRAANPALAPVVEKLEADHRGVAQLLDQVEAAATALHEDDGDGSRARVSVALEELHGALIAHLDYEENSAGPTIRRMRHL